MTLIGYRAKNHPQQIAKRGVDTDGDLRATDPAWFAGLHARYRFTIDACALPSNTKLPRYWTPEDDGLRQDWRGERVWCNPPFSGIAPWVRKAWGSGADLVVMLLPANRTEQDWWQRYVEPMRDGPRTTGLTLSVRFLRGRMRFIADGQEAVGRNERPPFGCCLLVWSRDGAL